MKYEVTIIVNKHQNVLMLVSSSGSGSTSIPISGYRLDQAGTEESVRALTAIQVALHQSYIDGVNDSFDKMLKAKASLEPGATEE